MTIATNKRMTREDIIREMQSHATECIREATAWQNAANALRDDSTRPFLVHSRPTGKATGKPVRHMSLAARERIASAQRARWAKWKRNNRRAA